MRLRKVDSKGDGKGECPGGVLGDPGKQHHQSQLSGLGREVKLGTRLWKGPRDPRTEEVEEMERQAGKEVLRAQSEVF